MKTITAEHRAGRILYINQRARAGLHGQHGSRSQRILLPFFNQPSASVPITGKPH
ncbi:hypothetical protein BURMUCGD1_6532 [Burkholderia multivorans CGD1]|nr:hypothetical protein BURMUCGD1_6532 [Burkholderia multivorans CGD1]